MEISSGNLKGEVQAMDEKLGIISGIMKFKSIRLDEISKGEHVNLLIIPSSTLQPYRLEESLTKGLFKWCGRV